MGYRNGVYVAFDGNGESNPTKSDIAYFNLLKAWNNSGKIEFSFSNSHEKTYQVRDTSSKETLRARLRERLANSKSLLIILSSRTNWDRGELNYEIEQAVDSYKLPLILVYPEEGMILNPSLLSSYWPKSLLQRIEANLAKCIHIPFKRIPVLSAIEQVSIHTNIIQGSLYRYSKEQYIKWGVKE